MEEAPENGKETSNSAHANGMNEWIQHQQCCSKEQCGNSGMRGLMLHEMNVWKCYVWTDDKLKKLVLEWKQASENHYASCLFKSGYRLSQLVGKLNF